MDLDSTAKDEELRLQDENCTEDDRHFILGSDAQAAIDVDAVLVVSRDRIDEPDRRKHVDGTRAGRKMYKDWINFSEI